MISPAEDGARGFWGASGALLAVFAFLVILPLALCTASCLGLGLVGVVAEPIERAP